jgi:hypothetical protein
MCIEISMDFRPNLVSFGCVCIHLNPHVLKWIEVGACLDAKKFGKMDTVAFSLLFDN